MTQGPYPPNPPGNGYPAGQPGQPGYPSQQPGQPVPQQGYPVPPQPGPVGPGYPNQSSSYPDQPSGYPDPNTGYPVSPAPGYAGPVTAVPAGQPVTGMPAPSFPAAEPPRKSRKVLYTMISVCTVLALAFGTTAYFMFFSGDAPAEVVSEFVTHAVDGDYDQSRALACADATEGVRFQGDAEAMDTMRRWFEDMEWQIRTDRTSGTTATVVVDKTLHSWVYEKPVPMRWDYKLERESGGWCIMSATIMSVVPTEIGAAGDCVEAQGFLYLSVDCGSSGDEVYKISDIVPNTTDCPNAKGPFIENEDRKILCLDENYHF